MANDDGPVRGSSDEPTTTAGPSSRSPSQEQLGDNITQILSAIERGDGHSAEQLLPLVYHELRRLAAAKMAQENLGHTLQATALVHEAYIRLVDTEKAQRWDSRGHFFAAAAEAMRRILVENARHKRSRKAGGGMKRVDLETVSVTLDPEPDDLLALDEALAKLTAENQAAAELAKLRLFSGLNVDQVAELQGVSRRTGFHRWTYARAFLQIEMQRNKRQEET
jgi:RNA polymerase sigma factor (TIGR02999 family)